MFFIIRGGVFNIRERNWTLILSLKPELKKLFFPSQNRSKSFLKIQLRYYKNMDFEAVP